MRFKKFISFLVIAMLLMSLGACVKPDDNKPSASDQQTEENQPGQAEESTAEETGLSGTIEVWSWDVALKSLQIAADNFKKIHPDVEFVFEDMGTDQIYDRMLTGLATGSGMPDVVSLEGERVTVYASKFPEGFEDLSSHVTKSDFLPVKVAECEINGKLRGVPWDSGPCGVFYRTDIFEEAGVKAEDIKTWDDFIEAGKKIDKLGVKMLPVAVSRNDTMFRILLSQLDGFYFDADGNTVLDSDAAKKAMGIVKKMNDAGIIYDNVNWDGLVTCTGEGKVATVVNAVWWAGTLQDECQNLEGKWAVMPLPRVDGKSHRGAVNGGSNIVVPASSQNKEAAIAFAVFAMTDTDTVIEGFKQYGLYPSYIPTYDQEIFSLDVPYFNNQKIWKIFNEVGQEVPSMNYTDNFSEVNDIVVNAQARILLKGAEVDSTMDDLQKEVVNMIGK